MNEETANDSSQRLATEAIRTLYTEIFDGATTGATWILNSGDPGLIGMLTAISAEQASRPAPGERSSIAGHASHLCYHLELLNRWALGEEPFSTADWSTAWKVQTVDDEAWRALVDELRHRAATWRETLSATREWNQIEMTGAMASAAHMAYHFAAIRHMRIALEAAGTPS